MKNKIISAIFALFLSVTSALSAAETNTSTVADTVGLAWNAVTEAGGPGDILKGYKIYFGKNPEAYTHVQELDLVTSTTIALPESGKWYFVCVSVNSANLESFPSDAVEYVTIGEHGIRPGTPTLRFVSSTTTKATTVVTVENITRVP